MVEVRLSGILDITRDTPVVATEFGSIHLAMKIRIWKKKIRFDYYQLLRVVNRFFDEKIRREEEFRRIASIEF